jgi:SPP1 gp7 family putative phage head morphogenesis protein
MKKQNPPLTNEKRKWVENRSVTLRGKQLNYNVSQQQKYKSSIKVLIKSMVDETKKQILNLFEDDTSKEYFKNQKEKEMITFDESISSQAKILLNQLSNKFDKLFNVRSKSIATKMINDLDKISKSSLHSSLQQLSGGLSLKTGIVTEGVKNVATAIVAENVSLIKTIPQEYFKNITGSVMRSITTGRGIADLIPEINKYAKTTERKAELMALDQTRKAYNSINKQRMIGLGVKQFEWIHSYGGAQPRQSHIKIDGVVFSFENLEREQASLGVPEADRGVPGYPINCRCTMNPVIDFSED